jgi:hypothetical protein
MRRLDEEGPESESELIFRAGDVEAARAPASYTRHRTAGMRRTLHEQRTFGKVRKLTHPKQRDCTKIGAKTDKVPPKNSTRRPPTSFG